jgi:hypothetical protein
VGQYTEGDKVVNSHPFKCGGIIRKTKMFGSKEETHSEQVDAVMLVYASGDTEMVCPICGHYAI